MTRQFSAAMLKGRRGPKISEDGKPRPGTRLREVYERLRQGEVLHIRDAGVGTFTYLRDFYGMVFESAKGPHGYIVLKGEWIGEFFVPVKDLMTDLPPQEPSAEPEPGSLLAALKEALGERHTTPIHGV